MSGKSVFYDPEDEDDLPLFPSPMARKSDPDTSHEAAGTVCANLGQLQRRVLTAFQQRGPMTAKECEALPCFADLGFSTVRKRASELAAAGLLEPTGEKRGRCFVLRVAE